jgi:hypothetical protein
MGKFEQEHAEKTEKLEARLSVATLKGGGRDPC